MPREVCYCTRMLSRKYLTFVLAIQGFGSGGCLATTEIIYADLVPLPQRGIIQGITAV